MDIEKIVNKLCDFVSYVDGFYNEKTGIYPIKGLTNKMILDATQKYITSQTESYTWGDGDSLDRERVREIIIKDNNLGWLSETYTHKSDLNKLK
jgi:hypothetical protein